MMVKQTTTATRGKEKGELKEILLSSYACVDIGHHCPLVRLYELLGRPRGCRGATIVGREEPSKLAWVVD